MIHKFKGTGNFEIMQETWKLMKENNISEWLYYNFEDDCITLKSVLYRAYLTDKDLQESYENFETFIKSCMIEDGGLLQEAYESDVIVSFTNASYETFADVKRQWLYQFMIENRKKYNFYSISNDGFVIKMIEK